MGMHIHWVCVLDLHTYLHTNMWMYVIQGRMSLSAHSLDHFKLKQLQRRSWRESSTHALIDQCNMISKDIPMSFSSSSSISLHPNYHIFHFKIHLLLFTSITILFHSFTWHLNGIHGTRFYMVVRFN